MHRNNLSWAVKEVNNYQEDNFMACHLPNDNSSMHWSSTSIAVGCWILWSTTFVTFFPACKVVPFATIPVREIRLIHNSWKIFSNCTFQLKQYVNFHVLMIMLRTNRRSKWYHAMYYTKHESNYPILMKYICTNTIHYRFTYKLCTTACTIIVELHN